MSGVEVNKECVQFCNGCTFANGVEEAPMESSVVRTAEGSVFDAEGRRSIAFTDGTNTTKTVDVDASIHGTFGSGDTKRALDMVVNRINGCEGPVAARGILRAKKCGAFYYADGTKRPRVLKIRSKGRS